MGHHHHHGHDHDHIKDLSGRKLLISIALNVLITAAQIVGGLISGSLALLSDALHNFSDVLSLVVSYVASRFSKKEASMKRTFGYKRAEIIAAFVNAASLIIVAVYLMFEAVERFRNPEEIGSGLVIWMSILGILANGFSVLLLKKESGNNMNMRSAYLHLLTDMMASVAVLVGGILMYYFNWFWIDSLLTLVISIYLVVMGYDLLKSSFKVLMLFTPEDIKLEDLISEVRRVPLVKNMHHIHIWQLNEDEVHLEAHIDFSEDICLSEFDQILEEIEEIIKQKGINHINIQPEFDKTDAKDLIVQD
ncbi:MAG: cation diffusion facilitator family transporter [Leeuwenhoekiella sp.]